MLVNCVAYQHGFKLADISIEAISDYVARPDCFVWVALKDPTEQELQTMKDEFGLHELAVEDARHGHQRPKIEEYGDSLFVVLQMIEVPAHAPCEFEIGEVSIFVGARFILSVRQHAIHGFQDVRARCEREPALLQNGSSFVLYALMDSVVDRYFPILDKLETELEQIEERIFSKQHSARDIIEELYSLKRRLMIVHHATVPLMETASKLQSGRLPHVSPSMQHYYRDVFDHLQRITRSIEGLREMLTTAIQVNLAVITLSENEVMKRLASYAALCAVPTLIAGIYGMNFTHMPELASPFGYPLTLLGMIAIDAGLWWRFKRARWL